MKEDLKQQTIILSRPQVVRLQRNIILYNQKNNISNKILNFNAGYIAKDKVNSFSKILIKFERLGKNKLKKLSVNASNCFKESFDLSSDRNSLSDLLKKNLAH